MAAATVTATDLPPAVSYPIKLLRDSPFQARHNYEGIEELAASIRLEGVLQAVVARRQKGTEEAELVFGHRRKRAAALAGLTSIPTILVDRIEDLQLVVWQASENLQRQDLNPLEEADQFLLLHDRFKLPVDSIADKIGTKTGYVYARMKLCRLCPGGRKAFLAGLLNPSVALYVARMPDVKQQEAAVRAVTEGRTADNPMPARDASQLVQRQFMLRLASAPFDVKDAKLVEKAGACTTCPKNTAAEKSLFGDVDPKAGDLCQDVTCYQGKCDASFGKRAAATKAKGGVVVDDKKAEQLFYSDGRLHFNAPFVDLDTINPNDPKQRSYRAMIGANILERDAKITVARDPQRKPHELIAKGDVDKLLKLAGHTPPKVASIASSDSFKEEQRKLRLEAEIDRVAAGRMLEKLAPLASKEGASDKALRFILERVLTCGVHEGAAFVVVRRGLAQKGKGPEELIRARVAALKGSELVWWIVELLAVKNGPRHSRDGLAAAAKVYGLDTSKLRAEVAKEVRSKGTKPKVEAKPAKPAAKSKPVRKQASRKPSGKAKK